MEKDIVLIPMELDLFWMKVQEIVTKVAREVVAEEREKCIGNGIADSVMETPGLTEKPLYRIAEICRLFDISRPTVDAWIADGRLRRVKIRGKVYFIGKEVRGLMDAG